MKIYSKSSKDIALENAHITEIDKSLSQQQNILAKALLEYPKRTHCLLCEDLIEGSPTFIHRNVPYYWCKTCEHVQSFHVSSDDFPASLNPEFLQFEKIYKQEEAAAYLSRRDRVYMPKLAWILDSLSEMYDVDTLKEKTWLEVGCGAGYFLHALKSKGFHHIQGIEKNEKLIMQANEFLPENVIMLSKSHLSEGLFDADVVVAFFVLEHVQKAHMFWKKMKALKPGTLFIFSVPTFGLSTLLESAFPFYAARNLDNALHTQLYTDASIDYALKSCGFKRINTWYFGQESFDFSRLLTRQLSSVYDNVMLKKANAFLKSLLDPIQSAVDKAHFCDARHIIALKENA